jgi:hypothetical protein
LFALILAKQELLIRRRKNSDFQWRQFFLLSEVVTTLEEEKHPIFLRPIVFLLSERRLNQLPVQSKKKKTIMCAESFVFFFQPILLGLSFVEEEGVCFARFFFS